MDVKTRAELVREYRFEIKKRYSYGANEGNGGHYGNRDPGPRDNATDYVNAAGGDGDIFDRAARWDRYRATRVPKNRRRFTPRAERDGPGGYVGYTGDWQGHFGGTPAVTNARIRVNKGRRVLPGRNR